MSPGPLRRLSGAVGLVALVPTAWLLANGAITLVDAAIRAIATLLVVVAVGRVIGWVVGGLAGSFEREEAESDVSGGGGAPAAPARQSGAPPSNASASTPSTETQDLAVTR